MLMPKSCSQLLGVCGRCLQSLRSASTHRRLRPPQESQNEYVESAKPEKPYVRRFGYHRHYWRGNTLLPRPESYANLPYSIPQYKPKDRWSEKYATFGQNDYIDILGDGTVKPWDEVHREPEVPVWLRHVSHKANELQRLVRKRDYVMDYWMYKYPHRWHDLVKRMRFLYKKLNIRKNRFK